MFRIFLFLAILAVCTQCSPRQNFQADKALILNNFNQGEYSKASELIRNSMVKPGLSKEDRDWLTVRQAMIERTLLDFSKTEEQVRQQLAGYYPALSDSLLRSWEELRHLEMRKIDGVRKYFKYSVSNLFRLDTAAAGIRRAKTGIVKDPLDSICNENILAILNCKSPGSPVETRIVTVEYTITVDAGAVPDGEELRCWMPFPRTSAPRQRNIRVIGKNPENAVLSAPKSMHSSLFAVKKVTHGVPTVFSYKASFEISAQWFDPAKIETAAGRELPPELKEYVREEPPHVVFSPAVRHLADSLSSGSSGPAEQIRHFYYWIDRNIPWASALEYSTFECIPDYVIREGHGDCGMKTFLLMSMARYKGIPARWQSGWMLHPGEENLHDWCELWFAGSGWIPVDQSFGLQPSADPAVKDFYLTGIDSYRMIVNDGFAGEFDPSKKFYRSEPFDFQRGEVEWSKGNLYFNQWDYNLNVVSIEKKNP